MSQSALVLARRYMQRHRFDKAITVLESRYEIYAKEFEYNLTLGTAYLYAGDFGAASTWFQKARNIKLSDNNLKLGQAALFMRRGDTNRAIQYYMDILDSDPSHKIAKKALEFIKKQGDYETICKWIDTGKMERFYPPLGFNLFAAVGILIPVMACIFGCILAFMIVNGKSSSLQDLSPYDGERHDLSALMLTIDEKRSVQKENDSSARYVLSAEQVASSYESACKSFQSYDDNLAQVEVNRILLSDAALSVKNKAKELKSYFNKNVGFDSIKTNFSYREVSLEPELYIDCNVVWSGRILNVRNDGKVFELLVGYDDMKTADGVVTVEFPFSQIIEYDRPVKILGKISLKENDKKIFLEGRSIFQGVTQTLSIGASSLKN